MGRLAGSGWLQYIGDTLIGAATVANVVHRMKEGTAGGRSAKIESTKTFFFIPLRMHFFQLWLSFFHSNPKYKFKKFISNLKIFNYKIYIFRVLFFLPVFLFYFIKLFYPNIFRSASPCPRRGWN